MKAFVFLCIKDKAKDLLTRSGRGGAECLCMMLSLVIVAEHHGLKAIDIAAIDGHGLVPRLLEVRKFEAGRTESPPEDKPMAKTFWQRLWLGPISVKAAKRNAPLAVEEAAHEIAYVLDRYQPEHWGLAVPGECVERLLGRLGEERRSTLDQVLKRDLSRAPAAEVLKEFMVR